jgi:uncharacterized protein DUF2844
MRYTVLSVLLMCLCRPGISWAILGDSDTSVLADQQRLQAQRYTTTETDYTVQQLETADGIVIREYVSPANMVFGVAWQGPKVPDLTQLFGAYFPLYQASFPTPVHRRSAIVIHTDDLVVEMTGHSRAFAGRAYIPRLVPSTVATEAIQ